MLFCWQQSVTHIDIGNHANKNFKRQPATEEQGFTQITPILRQLEWSNPLSEHRGALLVSGG